MALAGGVAVLTTPDFYVAASSAGMLSPTGRCRALDAGADGFVHGEAAAVVQDLEALPAAAARVVVHDEEVHGALQRLEVL